MKGSFLFLGLTVLMSVTSCRSLRCMECINMPEPTDCGTTSECEPDSYCFLESHATSDGITLYNSGCRPKQRCLTHTRSLPQDASTPEKDTRGLSDLILCEECCHDRDFCNHDGCNFTGKARPQRGPYCFDCAVQSDADMCRTIVECDIADMCGLNHDVRQDGEFKTRCISKSQCVGIHQAVFALPFQNIIGKRDARSIPLATCCDVDFCNDHRYIQNTTVDGIWSTWSQWSACTHTCGSNSTHQRSRSCDSSPAQQGNGTHCPGPASEMKQCQVSPCPVDGRWSQWTTWSACPATCGTGSEQTRNRKCDSPAPQHGGKNCSGIDFDKQSCNTTPCPVDGRWSQWTAWSGCPVTCGTGHERRHRKCDSPAPQHGGQNCSGPHMGKQNCSTSPCPVDGVWSTWTTWSNCSKSCGTGGVRHRQRQCNSPAPLNGGSDCAGATHQRDNCTEVPCPVHGHWSAWTGWSVCPKLCNTERHQYRTRLCNNPAPQFNGHSCVFLDGTETRLCAPLTCRVDGAWSDWEPWSTCTVTCGTTGMHLRVRKCSNSPPQHNGTECQGVGTEVRDCKGLSPCIVDGQWSLWSRWSSCTTTCGQSGQEIRSRACSSPAPQNGGKTCTGNSLQLHACNRIDCPEDGQWSDWQGWSACTATCGSQITRLRTRSCDNPAPRHHGKNCTGDSRQLDKCNMHDCPVDGHWSPWTGWTSCTVSCGPLAIRLRVRQCVGPLHGGLPCTGSGQETAQCTVPSC